MSKDCVINDEKSVSSLTSDLCDDNNAAFLLRSLLPLYIHTPICENVTCLIITMCLLQSCQYMLLM